MQLFIRFGPADKECHERLPHLESENNDHFWFKTLPGNRNCRGRNPLTATKLHNDLVRHYQLDQFYCISLIGKDPLRNPDFLESFLPMLRREGCRIFVATAAPSAQAFARIIDMVDLVCLDLELSRKSNNYQREIKKLSTVLALANPQTTSLRLTVDAHENPQILLDQIKQLPVNRHTLILQPKMMGLSHISDWDTGTIIEWMNLFAPFFSHIRWIPQVHKLLRIP
jgi:organic radical activating enzyme